MDDIANPHDAFFRERCNSFATSRPRASSIGGSTLRRAGSRPYTR